MNIDKYVITQDTNAITSRIYGGYNYDANAEYLNKIYAALLPLQNELGIEILGVTEAQIEDSLEQAVAQKLLDDPNAICIALDRLLCVGLENDPEFGERMARFSITRSQAGEKVARQGSCNFDEQLSQLCKRFPDIASRGLYVLDDGFFTGGTVRDFIEILSQYGLDQNIQGVIGFIGNGVQTSIVDVPVEIIMQVEKLYEWIDIRDFGIWGGKTLDAGRGNQIASAVPYIAPWSDGRAASLDRSPAFFDISKEMLSAQRDLLAYYQQRYGPVTFADLVRSGFPFPTNDAKTIPVTWKTNPVKYLEQCISLVEAEQARQVVILDMDGTLYDFIGTGSGYSGSFLEAAVNQNAVSFFSQMEPTTDPYQLFQAGIQDPIGLSQFASERYGITRQEYFNFVWNINPEGLLTIEESLLDKVQELSGGSFGSDLPKLVLLTAAPPVWMRGVLSYLGLSDAFEVRYSGDMYGSKGEIFKILAGRYQPGNTVSIGDQYKSDVEPAMQYGINGVQISGPRDTLRVLNSLNL